MDPVDAGIFEAWLASTDDGVLAVDAEGRVVLHNPAASRVTGLPPAAARHRHWREVLRLDRSVGDLLWSATSGRPANTLASVLCAQGNLRTAETHAHPWTDAEGRTGILVLIRDLTVLCRSRSGPGGRNGYGGLVGADPTMAGLYDLIEAIAPSDAPVVIEGETGSGKELVAQTIHARSRRAERPLVVVDCGAIASSLLEAELFGRARTAPHGAATIGRAELAHSGTLLLRRVGAAPVAVQARLLRLLDTGLVERSGEAVPRRVDVRMLVTTQRPLAELVREGRFDDHLLHRLQVVRVRLPSLRERPGDIPLLAEHFLAHHGTSGAVLSPAAAAVLQAAQWPGNVRQLEHAMRELVSRLSEGAATTIEPHQLPEELLSPRARTVSSTHVPTEDRRTVLLRALSSHGGNRTAAARALGIGRATFYRWWREAGLGSEIGTS
ncbi:MAG TPA: sigma 54-interacting transcriptional regulator [Gemmatimonadales bacterium]|nr:sigma 54-interacting transcriptional regulator [Gemmatimonadales bacterium]